MEYIDEFENLIASYYNAPYAVAVDCCTHAIELCLRLDNQQAISSCPAHTYVSVPMTLKKLNIEWQWSNEEWEDYYYLGGTNIIDAAVYWKKDGFIPGTKMCLSFQYKKHLNLGRGGMILLDYYDQYVALKKMSYDGRMPNIPWMEQNIDTMGYHYYMTPETAKQGIEKFSDIEHLPPRKWSWQNYPDISKFKVFNV